MHEKVRVLTQEKGAFMESYKRAFIDFMVESDVLKFGEFTLKSGRKSPFFMNSGAYVTGFELKRLGQYYAQAIHERFGLDFDVVIGLEDLYGASVRYCSNRKEIKDHGDTGILLGSDLKDGDRVLIVEDVTTSGKSIQETYPILKAAADVEVVGLMVSLDRQEVGRGGKVAALQEVAETYRFPTAAIVTMAEVVEDLSARGRLTEEQQVAIRTYYDQYGA